jgi:hypothetical protein
MLCPKGTCVTSWTSAAIRITRASSSDTPTQPFGSSSKLRLTASISFAAMCSVPIEWSKRVCTAPGYTR